jgi:DNA-binding response OmpR family regulator
MQICIKIINIFYRHIRIIPDRIIKEVITAMFNVLVVDDELEIVELLKIYLRNNGFNVFEAYDGAAALKTLAEQAINIVILDIMMPKIDGFQLIAKIREHFDIPVMFLSAKGEDMDKINGLGLGADDYMAKPFNPLEVIARIQALLRRYRQLNRGDQQNNRSGECIEFGNLSLRRDSCELYKKSVKVELTSMEYKLLLFMVANSNRVFTKQQLYENVWGQDYIGDENIIMVYISKLRERIEDDPKNPQYLKTIRGLGYRLERKQ